MTDDHKEMWMWRGFAIILLVIIIATDVLTYVADYRQHASDNAERARNWTMIQDAVRENAKGIERLNDDLHRCSGCHSHPPTMIEPPK